MGHRVDGSGHHINNYGQHTGVVGVYDGNMAGNALPYTTNYPAQATMTMIPGYGLPIKIVNPANSGNVINYSLNGFQYAIRPGESQSLVNDRAWVIQFDRGGEFGSARYSLNPGSYEFTPSVNGWEIFHESPQVSQSNNVMANPAINRLPSNPAPALPNSPTPAPLTFAPAK